VPAGLLLCTTACAAAAASVQRSPGAARRHATAGPLQATTAAHICAGRHSAGQAWRPPSPAAAQQAGLGSEVGCCASVQLRSQAAPQPPRESQQGGRCTWGGLQGQGER